MKFYVTGPLTILLLWGSVDQHHPRRSTRGNPMVQFADIKEDDLESRPPTLFKHGWFKAVSQPTHDMSYPWSELKSTCMIAKVGSFFKHAEMGEKGQNVISSITQDPISLIFAIHISFTTRSSCWQSPGGTWKRGYRDVLLTRVAILQVWYINDPLFFGATVVSA